MKAIISTKYGGPDVFQLQEVNKPIPNDNEVLVKIHAAPITTAGTMMRTGYPLIGRLFMGLIKPKNPIPGTGFAGTIEEVGEQVKHFKKGDKVFGESLTTFGTHAENVCIEEDGIIILKPDEISYEEASVVGDGHVTSLSFLKNLAKIEADQSILIIGALGSLGTAAVQLAKEIRSEVTGICSTRNIELVKSLGADKVIDYTNEDFTDNGRTYDVIYDTIGDSSFSKSKNSLTKNGIYMSPVLDFGLLFRMLFTSIVGKKRALFSATGMLPHFTIRQYFNEIKELMIAKKVKSIMDRSYSLAQIADAHIYIDKGHKRGNVVQMGFQFSNET